jgi:uncharacterized membrane protein
MPRLVRVLVSLSFVLGAGCTGGISGLLPGASTPDSGLTPVVSGDAGGSGTSTGAGSGGSTGSVTTSSLGIPCGVQMVLQTRCQRCHSAPPVNGAPMALMTLADLRAPAHSNATLTTAQVVAARMNNTTAPMPPPGATPATAAEIKIVTDWVAASAPAGIICGAPTTGTGTGADAGVDAATGIGTGVGTGVVGGGTGGSGGTVVTATGIPCDIQTLLQTRCQGCHSSPPVNGAPMSLVTYANLTAASLADPSMTFAQRAIVRMQSTVAPMPPVGNTRATATEIAAMTSWVAALYPKGTCGTTTTGVGGGSGTTTGTGGRTGTTTGTGGTSGGTGGATGNPGSVLPCDVQAVLQARCQGCHSNPPVNGAPMSLVSYANLTALSFADPTQTFAQRALSRMQNTAAPMPPLPNARASASDIATISNWVNTMYPSGTGTCGGTTTGTGGSPGTTGTGGRTGTGGAPGGTGTGGSTGTVANGLPCDIQALLQARCQGCHTNPLMNGAPMPLLTYANLTAASFADPTMTFAQRAAARMANNTSPMPPAPNARATATEIAAMNSWIASQYPMGTCGATTGTGGSPGGGTGGAPGTGGRTGTGGATGAGGAGGGAVVGLPCDVQTVFQSHCTTCHAATPNSGAPMPLVTRANLVAPSFANAAQTFAQRAVMRMQGNPSQMPPPPGTPPTATEIQSVSNWIAAGYPAGTCGTTVSPPPPDPFTAAPKCTSNTFWNPANEGSALMNPGLSCLSCHTGGGGGGNSGPGGGDNGGGGEAALYTIAGTLYPSAHEPDLCNGSDGTMNGARVVILDAANQTITLTPNAAGNFFYAGAVTFPFHAKVTFQGRERIMTAAQSNGSCNACHTQTGASGAPGRILLP